MELVGLLHWLGGCSPEIPDHMGSSGVLLLLSMYGEDVDSIGRMPLRSAG